MMTFKKWAIACVFFAGVFSVQAQDDSTAAVGYNAMVDLTNVQQDELYVKVRVPQQTDSVVEYHMPKIVPGTYSISDFGRFLSEFKAFDGEGRELPVERLDDNRWQIFDAQKLESVSYWVEDTYDTEKDNVIFEPAGTNITKDKNFVLNTFGFFGFVEGTEHLPYTLRVTKPNEMFGASSLQKTQELNGRIDVWHSDNYHTLADSPIMYCKPDTVTLNVGGAEVVVSVYSPREKVTAEDIMATAKPILLAAKDYLGGTLPCDRYAFLFYFVQGQTLSGAMGALEHMTSSFYVLPEMNPVFLKQTIKDVVAHEFFHIVTPLNIHSKEIGEFDYVNPKMSKHLWLYEGVTEYTAHHVQVTNELMSTSSFLDVMSGKMRSASRYNDSLAFTTMSQMVLEEHEAQYGNVYQKGALIGMCVDLKLRQLSNGEYGLPDLMQDLTKKYGRDVSFTDEELFDVIAELSGQPEIREFFNIYVEGGTPLPFQEYLAYAGLDFKPSFKAERLSDGGVEWQVDPTSGKLKVVAVDKIDSYGAAIGLKMGDEILEIDGVEITPKNFNAVLLDLGSKLKKGKKIKVTIQRPMNDGTKLEITKKVPARILKINEKYYITKQYDATDQQKALFEAWLQQEW